MSTDNPSVALLFRGDRQTRDAFVLAKSRFAKMGEALAAAGVRPQAVVFSEDFADEVKQQVSAADAVLVWVDPLSEGGDRTVLDALLRDVAQPPATIRGCCVRST